MVVAIIIVIVLFLILMSKSSSDAQSSAGTSQSAPKQDRSAGSSEETAIPLNEILPLVCPYNKLDEDIKYNFEQNPGAERVFNFRILKFQDGIGLEYPVVIHTSKSNDGEYCCDYTMFSEIGHRFMIFYNIYEFMDVELFLRQIRVKENGKYVYKQSDEVKKKIPTFCKLINNAAKVDKELAYGLPFITFMDAEQKVPLMAAWFHESSLEKDGDMDKLHIAMWKILFQMLDEMQKGGVLDQTKEKLCKNFVRIGLMLNRII